MKQIQIAILLLATAWSCKAKETDSSQSKNNNERVPTGEKVQPKGAGTGMHGAGIGPDGPKMGKKPARLPGSLTSAPWLSGATRVVVIPSAFSPIKGTTLIVAGGMHWLRWFNSKGEKLGEQVGVGAAQVLESFDVDGDGVREVLIGRGRGRGTLEAGISLEIHRLGQEGTMEAIPLPGTSRAQVVGISAAPGGQGKVWVASYVSKFEVQVSLYGRNEAKEWSELESRGTHRVVGGMTVLNDGSPSGMPIIARMYGKDANAPGGVYGLRSESESITLPSKRGARGVLALHDGTVVMADGWHKNYAKRAKGLLTFVRMANEKFSELHRVQVRDNYGYQRLRAGDVHRSKGLEVVASGNGPAVIVSPNNAQILFEITGTVAMDAYPADLSGDTKMEIVIVGPNPAIWSPL